MGTEQQVQEGAGGVEGAPEKKPAQAFGTATREPVFPAGQQSSTQTQEQQPGTQQQPAAQQPRGRGPVTTATIPPDALKARLERAAEQGRAPFLKALGVKSEAEAQEKLAKLKAAEEESEKRRLAEMSEVEALKTQLAAKDQRIAELEAQLASHEQEREHEQQEQTVARVAGEQVMPKALKLFRLDLAAHIKKLAQTNPDLAERFGERGIRRFMEKWLKDNPEFARAATQEETAPQAPAAGARTQGSPPARPGAAPAGKTPVAPVRKPVTTGVPQRKNPAVQVGTQPGSPAGMNGKTARPGQPNSMSPVEVKAFAAKHGVNYSPMG